MARSARSAAMFARARTSSRPSVAAFWYPLSPRTSSSRSTSASRFGVVDLRGVEPSAPHRGAASVSRASRPVSSLDRLTPPRRVGISFLGLQVATSHLCCAHGSPGHRGCECPMPAGQSTAGCRRWITLRGGASSAAPQTPAARSVVRAASADSVELGLAAKRVSPIRSNRSFRSPSRKSSRSTR